MVKFAAAGYVCVDYYPDFNNRYYITGNGVDVLFNLLDIKKGKDMEASIISAVSDDEYGKEAVKMFHERNIDCSHLEVIPGALPVKSDNVPSFVRRYVFVGKEVRL